MKKLILIFCFCMAFYCLAKAQPQDNSTATKDETIQWLTTKIVQYADPHPFPNPVWGLEWIITNSSVISGTTYSNENGGKSISNTVDIDLKKFIDYSIDTNKDEHRWPGCNYLLNLNCSSGSVIFVSTHDPQGNPGVRTAYIDEGLIYMTMNYAMKKRFISALEHLKKLSADNKDKF